MIRIGDNLHVNDMEKLESHQDMEKLCYRVSLAGNPQHGSNGGWL